MVVTGGVMAKSYMGVGDGNAFLAGIKSFEPLIRNWD
jgi:hypothetical protein